MQPVNLQATALADVNYLVLGLGVTGYSVANFLLSRGYACRVQDTREIPPRLSELKSRHASFEFRAARLDDEHLSWADVLVISPGLPVRDPMIQKAIAEGLEVIGDIELFARLVTEPVVAITGSNGKSTVTTLAGDMLSAAGRRVAVGGNLGTPALDLLEQPADLFVLELSSYQLETTQSLTPAVAALLNLSEDHLDRYPSYRDYVDAKHRVFINAGVCVTNQDDPETWHDDSDWRFSLEPASDVRFGIDPHRGDWLAIDGKPWLDTAELAVGGRHNWANCLAAAAIGRALGADEQAMAQAARQFRGIPHRSQWVAEIDGVNWINDSKATNVGAALASIEGLDGPLILIAGGQSKGADMTVMADALRRKVRLVLLLGEDADRLEAAWHGATEIRRVGDMREAVSLAASEAIAGDSVLLAPACASFDMYEKFEARGDDFMARVRELADG